MSTPLDRRRTAILYMVAYWADRVLSASDSETRDAAESRLRRSLRDLDGASPGWLERAEEKGAARSDRQRGR